MILVVLAISEPFIDQIDDCEQADQYCDFCEVLQERVGDIATVALAIHCLEVAATALVAHISFVAR